VDPDVYHGAPTAVTLVIGTAPKLAAFAMAMRLLVNGLLDLAHDWQQMLAILAVLSMALGNITAIAQSNLKRMLAYSTIAHMGFMLLGPAVGLVGRQLPQPAGRLRGGDVLHRGLRADVGRLLRHAAVPVAQGLRVREPRGPEGPEPRNPWYAFVMLLLMFSLAGVPPTVGFYAKLAVLSAAGQRGPGLARGGGGGVLAGRGLLLPAHRQADVLRRAEGLDARSPASALGPRVLADGHGLGA
jgi:NADH-quinone oxidoreductase subunit N